MSRSGFSVDDLDDGPQGSPPAGNSSVDWAAAFRARAKTAKKTPAAQLMFAADTSDSFDGPYNASVDSLGTAATAAKLRALFDTWGTEYICARMSEGTTLSALAFEHEVPPLYLFDYAHSRIGKDRLAQALRAAASSFAAKAELSLEQPDPNSKGFMAQVALAKAKSELYMTLAERLAPQDFGPPLPVLPPPAPVSVVMRFDQMADKPTIPAEYTTPVDPMRVIDHDSKEARSDDTTPGARPIIPLGLRGVGGLDDGADDYAFERPTPGLPDPS